VAPGVGLEFELQYCKKKKPKNKQKKLNSNRKPKNPHNCRMKSKPGNWHWCHPQSLF
jgi:hypothetical protein